MWPEYDACPKKCHGHFDFFLVSGKKTQCITCLASIYQIFFSSNLYTHTQLLWLYFFFDWLGHPPTSTPPMYSCMHACIFNHWNENWTNFLIYTKYIYRSTTPSAFFLSLSSIDITITTTTNCCCCHYHTHRTK